MFIYSYVTTEGIVKKVNQDALMIKVARLHGKEILFAAVCDGIGGLSGGEDASSCVIKSVCVLWAKPCALVCALHHAQAYAPDVLRFSLFILHHSLFTLFLGRSCL